MTGYREKRRRIRRYLIAISVLVVLISGLIVAGSIWAVRSVQPVISEMKIPAQLSELPQSVEKIPALLPAGCLQSVLSLARVTPWLERPLSANWNQVRQGCFPTKEGEKKS